MGRPVTAAPSNLLTRVDASRCIVNDNVKADVRAKFAQYMTPAATASFMASLFSLGDNKLVRLLDPGAGVGSLTSAFVERLVQAGSRYEVDVDVYEIDPSMRPFLTENLTLCASTMGSRESNMSWSLYTEDFVFAGAQCLHESRGLWATGQPNYTHCIMNPPYKKISTHSDYRRALRTAGIETVNLYTGFVAIALSLLREGGQLVAIIPRSFCNGPYYRPFREFILSQSAVTHIHLFDSRNMAFRNDKVLQENVIIRLDKGKCQSDVTVTGSTDDEFSDLAEYTLPFSDIVKPRDAEKIIHIPLSDAEDRIESSTKISHFLDDLGVKISTGPVVDFRLKEYLRDSPERGTVPLLYPCHFSGRSVAWPIRGGKKPNAIVSNEYTKKWLYPRGCYTVVRRFSSKEENRRIVASVVTVEDFEFADLLGFENHLNVFHIEKQGMPESLAIGLSVFLNSTFVDKHFRRFSGHTQVNATDLRFMKYPSRKVLNMLGAWAEDQADLTQTRIDEKVASILK